MQAWVMLNRLITGVWHFHSCVRGWGLASTPRCECDAEKQTESQVVFMCPTHRTPNGVHGWAVLNEETTTWLNKISAIL